MIKRLFLVEEMNESLENGIVCFKIEEKGVESHFFFTKNNELIDYFSKGFVSDHHHSEAYDILNNKYLELKAEYFIGEVVSVAHCYEPSERLNLEDVKLYLGNKTGPLVISEKLLELFSKTESEEFGIKDDNKFIILSACLGIEDGALEDIYLINEEEGVTV
jgi:hypothetical protein